MYLAGPAKTTPHLRNSVGMPLLLQVAVGRDYMYAQRTRSMRKRPTVHGVSSGWSTVTFRAPWLGKRLPSLDESADACALAIARGADYYSYTALSECWGTVLCRMYRASERQASERRASDHNCRSFS